MEDRTLVFPKENATLGRVTVHDGMLLLVQITTDDNQDMHVGLYAIDLDNLEGILLYPDKVVTIWHEKYKEEMIAIRDNQENGNVFKRTLTYE